MYWSPIGGIYNAVFFSPLVSDSGLIFSVIVTDREDVFFVFPFKDKALI